MKDEASAVLLLHNSSGPLPALNQELRAQGVRTRQARTCQEASQLLGGPEPPEVIFTETELPDGNWLDVVRLAENAANPINVIVVSRLVDIRLYVEALQNGAFDFIVPPFEPSELSHVLRCAIGNVTTRRDVQARPAQFPAPRRGQMPLPVAS
jgi:putative two-component system response regulator